MSDAASPANRRRILAALTGAILGGLLALALDAVGLFDIIKFDFTPLPWLVLAGGILGVTRARPLLWIANGLALVLILLASHTGLSAFLLKGMVRQDPAPAAPVDAVVVLSGGLTADNMMSPATLDRLLSGIERSRSAGAMVLSRETVRIHGRSISDSADQAKVLELFGAHVPVFFIDSATSTRDEALRLKRLAVGKKWARIGLVTSPLHSRRACGTFEKVGFQVSCFPSGYRESALFHPAGPTDRMLAFKGWLYEFAGTMKYRMSGWLP